MLNHELRHHLPGFSCGCVCVVGAIDLNDPRPGHHPFRYRSIHKTAHHIHISVENIVLRILMSAVYPLFGEHDRNFRAGNPADVAVVVNRPAHLVLDQVEGLALGPQLLAGNWDASNPLGGSLK